MESDFRGRPAGRVDLKVSEGGGGPFFAGRGGGRRRHLRAYPPSRVVSCCPLKLIAQPRATPLPLRVTSGGGGARYTSREVLLNPGDEAGHRRLERLDILTLVFL